MSRPTLSIATMAPAEVDLNRVQSLIKDSYDRYGKPRAEIEAEIQKRYQKPTPSVPPSPVVR